VIFDAAGFGAAGLDVSTEQLLEGFGLLGSGMGVEDEGMHMGRLLITYCLTIKHASN